MRSCGKYFQLAKLAHTGDDQLRAKLAEAISNCCELETNRALFGKAGAVAPLVTYLTSSDLEVHRTTAAALHQLSKVSCVCFCVANTPVFTRIADGSASQGPSLVSMKLCEDC